MDEAASFDAPRLARGEMARLHRIAEPLALGPLVARAGVAAAERDRIAARARRLVEDLRGGRHGGWIDSFLQEFGLDTQEGVALLGLAEAYLRTPDGPTASDLIHDKLGAGDWRAHAGHSGSLTVNSATLGLVVARALVADDQHAGPLKAMTARLGEPAVRAGVAAAMQFMGSQFVLGRDIGEALRRARRAEGRAFRYSFDMLGEGARTRGDARRYLDAYLDTIAAVGRAEAGRGDLFARNSVSVKLSALHPRYEPLQADRAVPELTAILAELARAAQAQGIGLTVDAEEADRLEMSLDILGAVAGDPALRGWDGLGLAVQAYQRRARAVVAWADGLAASVGRRLAVRLVKGAYWDAEIKRAQEQGLADYPVFTRKPATDVSYLACARDMLAARHLFPAFATHNALTVATVLEWAQGRRDFEFQRLHGMGAGLYERLVAEEGVQLRIYAPVGGYRDLLAYLVRRLLENGANSSFVNQLADPEASVETLIADPVDQVLAAGLAPHPKIPSPAAIYGPERRNSAGVDFSDRAVVAALGQSLSQAWIRPPIAAPLVGGEEMRGAGRVELPAPADLSRSAGEVRSAGLGDVDRALEMARRAQADWAARPVEDRAACLETMADLLERDRDPLMALCIREAGKTWGDALAEVREAVDFCRYYAVQARRLFRTELLPGPTGERNELSLAGRGTFVCISPWNFPLAIFLGQVTAALVAGNAVAAKPAPQTPLIAAHAVRLLLEAGVPGVVVHLLPGGPEVGQALVADRRTAGVAFTGSTATARRIARTLLEDERRPLAPLIAETGGLNAMIVDSTALPEQVVADVITSAFRSAGQRCSALRLLCLQEEVAEPILQMLQGAMAELRVGDPIDPAVDVGPVIDQAAQRRLLAHIAEHRAGVLAEGVAPEGGWYVPPTVIRLPRIEDLTEEVFGPVLHVVTWRAEELERVVDRVNSSGYGLTMGVHSRVAERIERVRGRARVGNLYVNRSMIGAVVGVQPFGGEGLSGTGPKAGGPHYLLRFATERTVSIDTTSAGGNASLLSLED